MSFARQQAARLSLLVFCIFQILQVPLAAESYSSYRLDDRLLLEDGKRELTGKGRFADFKTEINDAKKKGESNSPNQISLGAKETSVSNNGVNENDGKETSSDPNPASGSKQKFYANGFVLYRGMTQNGGTREEQADRSFSRGILSPEVGWTTKGERLYSKILISPFLQYEESILGTKTVTRGADGEFLWITGWDSPSLRIGIEAGRGYQRLDRNGFFFAGFANYGEFQFEWKPLGLSANLVGAQIRNSPLFSTRDRAESPQRISGGSLQLSENKFVQNFRIFYYSYQESRQEPVKGDFFLQAAPFRPYGKFQYYGLEFSSAKFFGFRLDADAIRVLGVREYGIDAFQSYQTRQSTNGGLAGARIVWEREEASYFLGGIYTSKDSDLRTDRNSNGYAGLRTDLRGYGGKTSFLLTESLLVQEGTVFREDGTASKPNYENKGFSLFQIGVRKKWRETWTAQGMILTSSSSLGRGWEGIATAGYQSEFSYILMSLSYAYVDPQRERNNFIDEWRTKEPIREYSRIYLSAGIYF
ncbi:hypothetical protein [Leptospira yasudae]|uniref:hypothetical protein n=1 Tax=Leptospira yasudae TaxID=2202201 RepID=UPI001F4E35AB|nr:hypothetical protein [Leptospira yasudae]